MYLIILSNLSFRDEGDEMALKIHQLLNGKPYDHIRIKYSLAQYISEDIAMHAGIPAVVGEYLRLADDTERFIVPGVDYMIYHGRQFAEMGDLDSAILILQTAVSRFPQSWQAYDALGDSKLQKIVRIESSELSCDRGAERAGEKIEKNSKLKG